MDISAILEEWPDRPDEITVRKIIGDDGEEKVQMRLDLGLLQMEGHGRPDGQRPFGYESLLDYHEARKEKYRNRYGTDNGFRLSGDECVELRNEALQFYYRYLSLFHLEDYEGVERDTARNLRVFDLINQHAENEEDRLSLERYRPYVLMMNARARANLALQRNRPVESLGVVEEALGKIRGFLSVHDREDYYDDCGEVLFLRQLAEQIKEQLPRDPREELRQRMQDAVQREDYELAAKLRDQIRAMEGRLSPQSEKS